MIKYRKISADSIGKLVRAYLREKQIGPDTDMRTEPGQQSEPGGRLNSYYTGRDSRGYWRPDMGPLISAALGIDTTKPPTDQELDRLFEAKRGDNGQPWSTGGRPRTLSGFDFVASPHKSVSLAAEFASTPAEAGMIVQAVSIAAERTMRFIAEDLGHARQSRNGKETSEAGEVGWFSVRHYSARPAPHVQDGELGVTTVDELLLPGDPHLHIHNILLNAVATMSGHVGSLDSARLGQTKSYLYGALFQAQLATLLRELGIQIGVDDRNKAATIIAVPSAVCEAFSKGSRKTERHAKAYARRQGLDWDTLSVERKHAIMQTAGLKMREKKYAGKNERELWRAEAERLGWQHTTVLEGAAPLDRSDSQRAEIAYEAAAKLLAEEFRTAASIEHGMIRVHATHGLIGAGFKELDDIDRVVALIEERGIQIDGEQVALVSNHADNKLRVTNTRQIRIEQQVAERGKQAALDRTGALSVNALKAAIETSGLDFSREPEHGAAQVAAIMALGTGGRLSFLTGVAGAGKSTLLKPLVTAYRADTRFSPDGREVIGAATAWRQADALKDAGIRKTFALQPLLDAIERGEFVPTENTVLVLEEVSQIAPRPMLTLLELQARTGMTIKALGDREQCQAIEAGDTIEIMRRVLPKQAMPELLTTVRQETRRERRIAALFRGAQPSADLTTEEQQKHHLAQVQEAVRLKREDGTLRLVGGDRDQVVSAIADLYMQRRDHLLASHSKRGITVSALTNEDVAEISEAIRARLKERGEVGTDETVYQAVDQRGVEMELPLATGDKVRLFRKTAAAIDGRYGSIGSNGDIVEIVGWTDHGLRLRNQDGVVGDVIWDKMTDRKTGRLLLGSGHALTIDAAQGVTSDEHIFALPRGSSGATAFKAYVAQSRHVKQSWTVAAEGAVREAVQQARAMGDQAPVTMDDLYDRMAQDLANRPYKSLALDVINALREDSEEATRAWLAFDHAHQAGEQVGRDTAAEVRDRLRREQLQSRLAHQVMAIDRAMARNTEALQEVSANVTSHLGQLRTATVAMHNAMAVARRRNVVEAIDEVQRRSAPSPG